MNIVDLLEARTQLSRLVDEVQSGRQTEIVIARHGKPVARLVAMEAGGGGIRLGVAKGLFKLPEDIEGYNDEVATLLRGDAA